MRVVLALAMMLALAVPLSAQTEEQAWQAVVSGQIEAFRAGDGEAALGFAGAGFRQQFSDPDVFIAAIVATGYGPIVASRSHSFGPFTRVSETEVAQVVRLVGPDQSLYEALYQLGNEPGLGWRVRGVILRKAPGMGI
ncbi:hypothetical protein GCM10007913_06020 [Devosia yakushimensis]|uniref:DUF4864 domain-containing protein n=1 Tax=Devosia yakushimensis TaxID=470028 RepID=A0ABQ5U952_9HYPH|nr:DUF4864 domain-containing protein [Devosia yakushimensis]GLQ08670.1 hypothetical protein GCM10007913_06020 [Devosia yakushimensis]